MSMPTGSAESRVGQPGSLPTCGKTQPSLDRGAPCVKPPGHYGESDNVHVTDNGFWWLDDSE